MFKELRTKLCSIDAVLNEEEMNAMNELDRIIGFDPSKKYTPEELKKLNLFGLEALKKSGNEFRYLLLEVRLDGESGQFTKLYLRGFDYSIDSHRILANYFLKEELRPVLHPLFELPLKWPQKGKPYNSPYERTINRKFEGLKLTISAIGGGRFDLKDNRINLRGWSDTFGSIPKAYQDEFRELLEQLVKRHAYNGFRFNFG